MLRGLLGFALLVASSTAASAALPAHTPAGFVRYCMEFASDCSAASDSANVVDLSDERLRIIDLVNSEVNAQIKPLSDAQHYGRAEYWTIPTDGFGDCEDYALTKRQRLIAKGFPAQTLLLAVVDTPAGAHHAVLTIMSSAGELVLDNLSNNIVKREETKYTWVEHEDANDLLGWVDYSDTAPAPSVVLDTAALSEHVAEIPPAVSSLPEPIQFVEPAPPPGRKARHHRRHQTARAAAVKGCAAAKQANARCTKPGKILLARH